ncbi:ATP-binding protein [Nonomuraea sp. NPDC046802]|uniref:YifB family Mg chelatase-like AAA ATPase n=1 Tax=Nonomuraea sp. NPDC046802 TaxID=3154919 RepID=UPI0033D78F3A
MGFARTFAAGLVGSTGYLVDVEADVSPGPPATRLLGLADAWTSPTLDRVRAALANSGFGWPAQRVLINVSSPDNVRSGCSADLSIATAILAAVTQDPYQPLAIPSRSLATTLLLGELGLDGSIRPVRGVLPMVLSADSRINTVLVPEDNLSEATLAPDVKIVAVRSLNQVVKVLRGEFAAARLRSEPGSMCRIWTGRRRGDESPSTAGTEPDLRDIAGQPLGRFALEVSAAGGHSLLLVGPAGSAKTMLAERLAGLLPDLTAEQARDVAAIHSAAGLLSPASGQYRRPPYMAPHHTATMAALLGGGAGLRPGAVSLAHHGVLALLDAPEFLSVVLQSLRQPSRDRQVNLAHDDVTVSMPAGGIRVLTAAPCPCATSERKACGCSTLTRRAYQQRLNPLLPDIDITVHLKPASGADMLTEPAARESSADVAARVEAARRRSAKRLDSTPWRTNAEVPVSALMGELRLSSAAVAPLLRALDAGDLSAAGLAAVQRLAWTLADLAEIPEPTAKEAGLALSLRKGLDSATFTRGREEEGTDGREQACMGSS